MNKKHPEVLGAVAIVTAPNSFFSGKIGIVQEIGRRSIGRQLTYNIVFSDPRTVWVFSPEDVLILGTRWEEVVKSGDE